MTPAEELAPERIVRLEEDRPGPLEHLSRLGRARRPLALPRGQLALDVVHQLQVQLEEPAQEVGDEQ